MILGTFDMFQQAHCAGGSLEAVLRDFVPGEDAASEIPLKLEQFLPRVRHIVSIPADMTWDACLFIHLGGCPKQDE